MAAAYAGRVDVLVTSEGDINDFQRCLDHVNAGIEVQHVDDFLCMIAERHPHLIRLRYRSQIAYWQHRARSTVEAVADSSNEALDRAGAKRFAFMLSTDERFRIW